MDAINIKTQTIILFIYTLLSGLVAGIFFTWANAVTPGIGRLDDLHYLKAFQHMNKTILNPLFYIVVIGPMLLSLVMIYFYKSNSALVVSFLMAAAVMYFTGVFLVTMLGNVPLNHILDLTNLEAINQADAHSLRSQFEDKWNRLHLIRTFSAVGSFAFLILSCLFIVKR